MSILMELESQIRGAVIHSSVYKKFLLRHISEEKTPGEVFCSV